MSTGWTFKVVLPAGGAQVEVDQALAVVEPMGDNGVRIKWPAETRREVRLSVEQVPIEGAFGQLMQLAGQFGGNLAAQAELEDGKGQLFVFRVADPRRHVVVATRAVRKGDVVQISMESGADPAEVGSEWTLVDQLFGSTSAVRKAPDGPGLILRPTCHEHRIRFELPPDTYVSQWAYGMAQLRRRGTGSVGRMVYGALAAADLDACRSALEVLGADGGLSNVSVWTDGGDAVISADLVDRRGLEASLLAGCRPLGRGVALFVAALSLPGETGTAMEDVLSHAVATAATFGRARKPSAPTDPVVLLNRIDSFRHRTTR